MTTTKDIENDLTKISEILFHCRQLTFDGHLLNVPSTNEKHIIISNNKFLSKIGNYFWKLSIIELTKLYSNNSKNDHFSIFVLIDNIRELHKISNLNNLITLDELNNITTILKSPDTTKSIDKLKEIRKQRYAHTDRNPKNNIYNIGFYYDDIVLLINKAEQIIESLSKKLTNNSIKLSHYEGQDVNSFLDDQIKNIKLAGQYNLGQRK